MREQENKALEQLNSEYLQLLRSPEYRVGHRITRILQAIKKADIALMTRMIRRWMLSLKMKRLSDRPSRRGWYFTGEMLEDPACGCVYSCVTDEYDELSEPVISRTAFFYFTNKEKPDSRQYDSVWQMRNTDWADPSGTHVNRYYKMHPFQVLPGYRFTLYVDGNVQVISDISDLFSVATKAKTGIAMHLHADRDCAYEEAKACYLVRKGKKGSLKKQMRRYREEGFPQHYGLFEATVIAVDNENPCSRAILEAWWEEFLLSDSDRDQISFPYILWKMGYDAQDVGALGDNVFCNPKFRIFEHDQTSQSK